jgi:hypothetical protein
MQCLDDLQFKCIFQKQSGSEINVRVGSGYGSEKNNNFRSTTLITQIFFIVIFRKNSNAISITESGKSGQRF